MMRGGGKGRFGGGGRGVALCMLRCVSEQAGATKPTIRVAVKTSITSICHAIVALEGLNLCCC